MASRTRRVRRLRRGSSWRLPVVALVLVAVLGTAGAMYSLGDPRFGSGIFPSGSRGPSQNDPPVTSGRKPSMTCPDGERPIPAHEPEEFQMAPPVDKVVNAAGAGVLDFGTLLPETGGLAVLGPAMFAAVDLAIQDINAGGGVLDRDVTVSHGDSGDATTAVASREADRLVDAGVDAIVGAASSVVSLRIIDEITGAGVILFSPANTSAVFTTHDDGGLFFRTAPSDVLQARALADLVAADGFSPVAVMARNDAYGIELRRSFERFITRSGGEVGVSLLYDPMARGFDAQVDRVVSVDPKAVVVIGFEETAQIITELEQHGFGPNDVQVYGTASNMDNLLSTIIDDPSVLTCMKGTTALARPSDDFEDRLLEIDPDLVDFSYAAESYDAIVITALAAAIAGTDDAPAVAGEINAVTRGPGLRCTSFEECKAVIDSGTTDIDYDGIGGPYDFTDAGEPGVAVFAIPQFDAAGAIAIPDYRVAEL